MAKLANAAVTFCTAFFAHPAKLCRATKTSFDSLENHHPTSEDLLVTTTGNEKLSAHGVMSEWISKNLSNVKLYLGYDGELYPQFRIKTINTYNGK